MKTFKLDQHTKTTGFKVPENYFEALTDKVMSQLPERGIKVIPLYKRKRTWLYAAAAVLVLALMVPLANRFRTVAPDTETLENYLAYHTDIPDEQLVDLLESEDIEKIEIDYRLEDAAVEDVLSANSNLEHYLTN